MQILLPTDAAGNKLVTCRCDIGELKYLFQLLKLNFWGGFYNIEIKGGDA